MTRTLLAVAVMAASGCLQAVDDASDRGSLSPGSDASNGSNGSNGLAPDGSCASFTLVNSQNTVQPAGPCLCTRGAQTSLGMCRKGANETASATIGPAGGTLELVGQQGGNLGSGASFRLTFPPNVLASPTVITVTETSLTPPGVDWSPVYKIEPLGLEVTGGVDVRVPWGQANGVLYSDQMSIYASGASQCGLEPVRGNYVNAGFNTGTLTKLGYVMIGFQERGSNSLCTN